MAQRRITMKLDIGPGRAQCSTRLAMVAEGDAILFPDEAKVGGSCVMIGMAGIGHYHGGGLKVGCLPQYRRYRASRCSRPCGHRLSCPTTRSVQG